MVPQHELPARADHWMLQAIILSRGCPPSSRAYSVGAIIVTSDDVCIASGFSREYHNVHAEEAAIEQAKSRNIDLSLCTLYSTMEPCSSRLSGAVSCVEH